MMLPCIQYEQCNTLLKYIQRTKQDISKIKTNNTAITL